jgi:hypothetical protein
VIERAILPSMAAHIPYVPAVIELPDAPGIRLIASIVGAPIGGPVHALWEDHESASLVRFALGTGQGGD